MPIWNPFDIWAFRARLIEPAIILSMSAFLVYLFGAIYNQAYFSKFSFPYEYLNLLNSMVISRIILLIILNLITIFIVFPILVVFRGGYRYLDILYKEFNFKMFNKEFCFNLNYDLNNISKKCKIKVPIRAISRANVFASFTLAYIFFFALLLHSIDSVLNYIPLLVSPAGTEDIILSFFYIYILVLIILLVILGIKYVRKFLKKIFVVTKCMELPPALWIAILFIILFCNIYLIGQIGMCDAIRLIEGAPGSYEIKLDQIDPTFNLSNKTLILVMQHEGNYYFVEKQTTAPLQSPVFSIPINRIKIVEINRIKTIQPTLNISIRTQPIFRQIWRMMPKISPE